MERQAAGKQAERGKHGVSPAQVRRSSRSVDASIELGQLRRAEDALDVLAVTSVLGRAAAPPALANQPRRNSES